MQFRGTNNARYAEIGNWVVDLRADRAAGKGAANATAHWPSSRYDLAQIHRGIVVVDAVGQPAGTLQMAGTSPSAKAVWKVVAGWLDVAGRWKIGSHEVATLTGGSLFARRAVALGGADADGARLRLLGGKLSTPALYQTGRGGEFYFAGGTLEAGQVAFPVVNRGGTIAPGPGIGRTELLAKLEQLGGSVSIEVARNSSDQVVVARSVQLGGVLDLTPVPGFTPRQGDAWLVLAPCPG